MWVQLGARPQFVIPPRPQQAADKMHEQFMTTCWSCNLPRILQQTMDGMGTDLGQSNNIRINILEVIVIEFAS